MKKIFPKSSSSFSKKMKLALAFILLAGIAISAFAAYCYYSDFSQEELIQHEVASVPSEETKPEVPEVEVPQEPEENIMSGVITSGTTAGTLLLEWLDPNEVQSFIEASKDVYALHKIRAGQPYSVTQGKEGLTRFEYEIDDHSKLVVCKEDTNFTATLEKIEYDTTLQRVTGVIDSSLFATMSDAGETPVLAVNLAEIFAWEINFIRDIQPNDSFSVLVEKRYREGEFKGYGKILAAEFTNKGKTFEAYVFSDNFGKNHYYNSEGESLKRAFLKAPLSFTRISSRFTLKRFHPILQTWRAHPAIDYAAPQGTPVKAVGDGTVVFSGRGKGAGNYITLKHYGGYETNYLHLSGFAKGMKKGIRVSQGQVIGYVGSTGYSTGPHLDFRMKKNGQWVNPETALSPRAEPLNKKDKEKFKAGRDVYREYLSGKKPLSEYGKIEDSPS